jgi:hypothetical protein
LDKHPESEGRRHPHITSFSAKDVSESWVNYDKKDYALGEFRHEVACTEEALISFGGLEVSCAELGIKPNQTIALRSASIRACTFSSSDLIAASIGSHKTHSRSFCHPHLFRLLCIWRAASADCISATYRLRDAGILGCAICLASRGIEIRWCETHMIR